MIWPANLYYWCQAQEGKVLKNPSCPSKLRVNLQDWEFGEKPIFLICILTRVDLEITETQQRLYPIMLFLWSLFRIELYFKILEQNNLLAINFFPNQSKARIHVLAYVQTKGELIFLKEKCCPHSLTQ